MATIFEYLKWRGDLLFTQDAPNAVDALIFSGLSYIPFTSRAKECPDTPITLREAADEFLALEDCESRVRLKNDMQLLKAAADTQRFGLTQISMYRDLLIPEQETQFAAVTFLLDDGTAFLAFRGTDDSLVGWKEDFNMSFQQTVPAQRLALQYTRDVALEHIMPLRLAGHSKGGNAAVFAAARSSPMIQSRILNVYNHDGPGFTDYMMGDPGYIAMVPRIKTYIPQSSVIGMLLEHEEPYTVIKSRQVGLLQHDFYSWEVMGKSFVQMQEVSSGSQMLDNTIKNWFAQMSNQERSQLVDVMFTLLGTGGVENAWDIFRPKNIGTYLKTLSTDENLRHVLSSEFQSFIDIAKKTKQQMEESKVLPEGDEGIYE